MFISFYLILHGDARIVVAHCPLQEAGDGSVCQLLKVFLRIDDVLPAVLPHPSEGAQGGPNKVQDLGLLHPSSNK